MQIPKKYTPIIFGLVMGFLMTVVMSFAMVAINVGFVPNFFVIWLSSFITGFIVGTPVALLAGPIGQQGCRVGNLVEPKELSRLLP